MVISGCCTCVYLLIIKPWLKIFCRTLIANFSANLDFLFSIAIMIPIKNLIRIDQTLIENFPPDFDFLFVFEPWLKNSGKGVHTSTDGGILAGGHEVFRHISPTEAIRPEAVNGRKWGTKSRKWGRNSPKSNHFYVSNWVNLNSRNYVADRDRERVQVEAGFWSLPGGFCKRFWGGPGFTTENDWF